jgi:hypothetical protein
LPQPDRSVSRCSAMIHESREAFHSYCGDPGLADLHAHLTNGSSNTIWHPADKPEGLRTILK